jgi:secreted trypsin-like serine protease
MLMRLACIFACCMSAGWSTDNEDTCAGDSGGPLVKKRSSGDLLVSCTQTHECTSLLTQLCFAMHAEQPA